MSSVITELETAVQALLQQNTELKKQLATLAEQHENLQLELMEKDEKQQADMTRLQSLLQSMQA